ncbi:uncharacterized protein N7515_005648 [Penicillium bovifimosum]|uniref:Uncharacterized protein n=1 Tax=Penicillium bovifimosum TaxID=126998 RepID=A0A9W9GUR3_9EURO|nr:uncharacterized protein N7515_005648 [Penicillium bovifimosum]KAJ5129609.1 hypothetical protein N7515_005648 [Penicillium bovifimosum]
MTVYILHIEAISVDRENRWEMEPVNRANQQLSQFQRLANSELTPCAIDYPNKDPTDTSALRECNIEFSIPDDLSVPTRQRANNTLDELRKVATFTIKDKESGEEQNPFA